ncbi:MAG: membrane protein insertion efficiency factor YidD [Thermodesulfobacteriota bacterium]|nr:membrane protein insertion efficiency factor YidD [Thermodesulfobacteriota bacterium]
MLPRIKLTAVFSALLLMTACAGRESTHGPFFLKNIKPPGCVEDKKNSADTPYTPGRVSLSDKENQPFLLRFYKKYISPADGDRCPMDPGCSLYAARAFEKHGFLMGWVMACDRLLRCGRDEMDVSPPIIRNGKQYCYDPVSANDFWWHETDR